MHICCIHELILSTYSMENYWNILRVNTVEVFSMSVVYGPQQTQFTWHYVSFKLVITCMNVIFNRQTEDKSLAWLFWIKITIVFLHNKSSYLKKKMKLLAGILTLHDKNDQMWNEKPESLDMLYSGTCSPCLLRLQMVKLALSSPLDHFHSEAESSLYKPIQPWKKSRFSDSSLIVTRSV